MESKRPLSHQEEREQMASDHRAHNESDPVKQRKILLTIVESMETSSIPYAVIGGIAGKELGRPRVTHDIDVFVKPEDAPKALVALKEQAFKTEKRDPAWLYKAWKDDILVDIIFKSAGDIYFDEEIQSHVRRVPYKGHFINAISPEDFIVIKAAVHQEQIPHHWHDALAVLTEGELDWEYFVRRSRHAPRRVLSLLIYAQSNDIAVPLEVIQTLYKKLFETSKTLAKEIFHPYRQTTAVKEEAAVSKDSIIYTKGKIIEALSSDGRTADHDIKIVVTEKAIDASGEVFTQNQKDAIKEVLKQVAPEKEIRNFVNVRSLPGPEVSEVIQ